MPRHRLAIRLAAAAALFSVSVLTVLAQPTRRLRRISPETEPRWALVIGNADYDTGRLNNPVNDARDVSGVLQELGFSVNLLENAGHQAMEDAVRSFSQRLQSGGVGLFYFAGHGVQVNAENYLIPIGAQIDNAVEVPYKSMDLNFVLDHLGEAPDRLNIVILDACRDNPFPSTESRRLSAHSQGLAHREAPTGTIIAFATSPGKVAADGDGENGIFTEHLLAALRTAGLTIEQVFKETRRAVARATDRRQVPWTSSSLLGEFVPRPAGPEDSVLADADAAAAEPAAVLPPESTFSLEELNRKAIAYEDSHKAWDEYYRQMTDAFDKVDEYEERNVPAQVKAEAWDYFLSEFEQDHPYTEADNSLRSQAMTRRELWDREASRISAGLSGVEFRPVAPQLPEPEPGAGWQEPVSGTTFRYVPAGEFCMGSPRFEMGRDRNEVPHDVTLTRGFWMAETELTQRAWRELLGSRPSYFDGCDDCPVERVSWYEAAAYANVLSESAGLESCYSLRGCRGTLGGGCLSGNDWCFGDFICMDVASKGPSCDGFRLPTEAEWEYSARAGTTTAFWQGEYLSLNQANIYNNKYQLLRENHSGTVPVASFGANPWGLHDVHGNVLEWTWDYLSFYASDAATDPDGPWEGKHRVARSGSWKDSPDQCRAAARRRIDPGNRFNDVGFRLVRSAR